MTSLTVLRGRLMDCILAHGAERHTFADQRDAALAVVLIQVCDPRAVLPQFGNITRGDIDLTIRIVAADVTIHGGHAEGINTAGKKDDPSTPFKNRIDRLLDGIGIIGHAICLAPNCWGVTIYRVGTSCTALAFVPMTPKANNTDTTAKTALLKYETAGSGTPPEHRLPAVC